VAINVPIISEFQPSGLKKAMAEFKRLKTTSEKVAFGLKKAFLPATAALGGLAAAAVPAIKAASDLEEAQSKVNVIFGEGAEQVEAFAETAAKSIGQSKQSVLDAAGTFGTFGKAAGLAGPELAAFSNELTQLASDAGSFHNADPSEVIEAMGAALRGEAEPMRRFGVLLNDAVLKEEALALGIYDGNGALTSQQKILAAHQVILKQTTDAQGDFARTSDGLANGTRIAQAQFQDLTAELGSALLPVILKLLPVVIGLADWMAENTDLILILTGVVAGLSGAIIVANVAMKAWAAAQAIATAAQWLFNAALTANPIGLVVVAIAALVAGLVILYKKVDWVRDLFNKFLGPVKAVGDAIGWLAGKLGLGSDEVEDFTRTVDTARKEAGDMYAPLKEMGDQSEDTAAQMETLAEEVNAVERELRELNPALDRTLRLLDVQDDIASLEQAFRHWKDTLADSTANTWDQEEAQRELTRRIIETLKAHELLTLAFDQQLKMKIDTGDLDAAYASAMRVLDAFQKVKAVSSGAAPASTYLPGPGELDFRTGAVQTIDIRPTGTATRDFQSGNLQNITVNVQTLEPTPSVARAIVDSVRKAQRSGVTPGIGRR